MAWKCMTMGCASRRLAVPVATLLLVATNLGAGAGNNPAAEIAVAAGHPAQRHLRAEATRVRDGQAETATLELAGSKRLDRVCSADLCAGTWFDGLRSATFGINGTPQPDRDDAAAAERTFAAIASTAFAEPNFIAAGGTVRALPGPHDAHLRYRVIAPQGAELIAVADAKTRRLTGVELPDRTPYRELTASVSGATIVYAARSYDRIVADEAPIVPPAGPRVAVAGAREVALLSNALPIVPCMLGGRQASCLIDTGTSPSAVTLDFAEQLGLEPRGRIEIAGLATYLTGVVDAGPLLLAGAAFERLRFAVIPRVRGAHFDAIVGSDALADLRIAFDVARHRAQVAPSEAPPAGRPIAVTFARGLPYMQVRLGTRGRSEAMLVDTGDSATLSIGYDEYREDIGLFAVRAEHSATGLGGVSTDALEGTLVHADIGGEPVDAVAISAVRGQHVGHVGYGFASRCGQFILNLGQHRVECLAKAGRQKPSTGDH